MKFMIPPVSKPPPLHSVKDALLALTKNGVYVRRIRVASEYNPQMLGDLKLELTLVLGPTADVGGIMGDLHEFATPKKVSLVTP